MKIKSSILLGVLCLINNFVVFGQAPRLRYIIKDSESKSAVSFALIEISQKDNNHIIYRTSSDQDGYFYIKTSKTELSKLDFHITAVGYQGVSGHLPLKDSVLYLTKSVTALNEVTIKARKRFIRVESDKLIYEIAKDSLHVKQSVSNALRAFPGVFVSLGGDISCFGDKKILYLLNGKEDPLVKSENELRALPAHYIARIELITNPDPKYKEMGYDFVINLISKADIIEGTLGSLTFSGDSRKVPNGSEMFFYRKNRLSVNLTTQTRNEKSSSTEITDIETPGSSERSTAAVNSGTDVVISGIELDYQLKHSLIYMYGNYGYGNMHQNSDYLFYPGLFSTNDLRSKNNHYDLGAGIRMDRISKSTNGRVIISVSNAPTYKINENNYPYADSTTLNQSNENGKEITLQSRFTTRVSKKIFFDYGLQSEVLRFSRTIDSLSSKIN